MTNLRDVVDRIPVPDGLERRIRASVALKRRLRWTALAAAAALLLIVPNLRDPPPPRIDFAVSLKDPAPSSLDLRAPDLTTRVAAEDDTLSFTFMGKRHD
jgi:hypothetical protein